MSPRILPSLAALLLVATPFTAKPQNPPAQGRGIWFWQSPTSPFGSVAIVGNSAREDATIAQLKTWKVTTLYGSYPASASVTALRAWNRKLTQAGITSLLLLSETAYLDPATYPQLDAHIHRSFLDFNASASPEERFAGLALDIEPHIDPTWKTAAPFERRAALQHLLQLHQHVRSLIPAPAQLEATLPTWYSHLGGSIGWTNALDRDTWFTALASSCDRLSIMAFELNSPAAVLSHSEEELTLLRGHGRIALRANLGHEWPNTAAFWATANTIERQTHAPIDIQSFAILAQDVAEASSQQKK